MADRPKVLAEVGGRPFLAHLLAQIDGAGLRRAVLCTGYLGDQVTRAFGRRFGGVQIAYCREPSPLGTGGALRNALDHLASEELLILNGDSYLDADLSEMWDSHRLAQAEGTIALTRVADASRYGRVALDDAGRIVSFVEKDAARPGPGWINAGVYLLSRAMVASIPRGAAVSLEREAFPAWLDRPLHGYRCEAGFLDIGTPESLAEAEGFFASRAGLPPRAAPANGKDAEA